MTERLMVKEQFGEYSVGDRITDARTMKKVTASHPDYVLRETVPDEAEPVVDASTEQPAPPAPTPRTTRHTVND